jgi:hypothetical protein
MRGTTRVFDGRALHGGEAKVDAALEAAPALLAHAKAAWPTLTKRH